MEMTRPKYRLEKIIEEYRLRSKAELARALGLTTPASVWDILSRNPDVFNNIMLKRLISAFPELDPQWIKTGEGEMFQKGMSPRNIHFEMKQKSREDSLYGSLKDGSTQGRLDENVTELMREVDLLRRENAELRGELKATRELYKQLLKEFKR